MASGKVHAAVSCVSAVVLGSVVSAWTQEFASGLLFVMGNLVGIILSPDLDQEQITISEALMARIPVIGLLFRLYFYPYAWVFPHRSFFTHFPFVGTVIRLVYVLAIPLLVMGKGVWLTPWYAMWVFIGLCTSDIFHWVCDGFPV